MTKPKKSGKHRAMKKEVTGYLTLWEAEEIKRNGGRLVCKEGGGGKKGRGQCGT